MENGVKNGCCFQNQQKLVSLTQMAQLAKEAKAHGQTVVQCHGVFDLLHPGHIRHFEEARSLGDILVVSITPDIFVNKGPGRPVFNESLRQESVAALSVVDYVVLNDSPDAISCIKRIRPDVYVKGDEYQNPEDDVTGKISDEAEAVSAAGGRIHYTSDIVFSSSSLLNQYISPLPSEVQLFVNDIKRQYSIPSIVQQMDSLKNVRVLVVGDAMIDEYQYVEALGQSGKGINMVGLLMDRDVFMGGALAIARQLAEFSDHVSILSAIGGKCCYENLIEDQMPKKVRRLFFKSENHDSTLIKRRYLQRDGNNLSKLFETYTSNDLVVSRKQIAEIQKYLIDHEQEYDIVLVCDFGNGFFEHSLMETVSSLQGYLALNTQANSGNRGFNVATHYKRANFLSLNVPELRLATQDRYSDLGTVVGKVCDLIDCPQLTVTDGVHGVHCYLAAEYQFTIPALSLNAIDRVGAGDTFFAVAALCLAAGFDFKLGSFVAAAAAAIGVQIIGCKQPVKKIPLCKFLTRLMK